MASGIQTIGDIYRKHEEGNISDIHYVLSRGTMTAFQASIVFSRNQKKVTQVWEESFDLAQRLKQELGVKEFVKLSAKEHKNDLMKISPMV